MKPENVKITPRGVVKVLDFGLAKELVIEPPAEISNRTKTGPSELTREDWIVGTPPYMSPEQVRRQSLDKRTDIWSFGCCLFEALSGSQAFQGRSMADVLAAVINVEPNLGALPPGVPPNILHLLRRCLQKDLHRRLKDIGDARIEIEETLDGSVVPEPRELSPRSLFWPVVGLAVILAAGLVLGGMYWPEPESPAPVRRFALEIPPTESLALGGGPGLAISPDGATLAYAVLRGATTELRLRSMDRLEPRRLPETEGAQGPFFAPSGDAIGFFSEGRLRRISLGDSTTFSLGETPSARGASWIADRILFSPRTVSGLYSLTFGNPTPALVTELSVEKKERSHRWPSMLPGGRHALFTTWVEDRFQVEVVDLETRERRLLVEDGSFARYAPTGHVLFVRDGALMAASLDEKSLELTSAPVPVVEGVYFDALTGAAFYDVSQEGTLVYVPRVQAPTGEVSGQLLLIDRNGTARLLNPTPHGYQVPRFSPSGRQLVVTLTEEDSTDIWLSDVSRGTMSRLTFEGNNGAAIWNPDGERITFSSDRNGSFNLYWKAIDGSQTSRRITSSPNTQFPCSWSPDGSSLAYTEIDPDNQLDLWLWNESTGKSAPILQTPFNESAAVFSPEGRFIAYVSDETGQDEVYVRALEEPGGIWPISTGGGREPVWSDGGSELFYRSGEWMVSVPVQTEPQFSPGAAAMLFEAPFDEAGAPYANYEATRDGREFIMVRSAAEYGSTRVHVVLNWFQELETRVPNDR